MLLFTSISISNMTIIPISRSHSSMAESERDITNSAKHIILYSTNIPHHPFQKIPLHG